MDKNNYNLYKIVERNFNGKSFTIMQKGKYNSRTISNIPKGYFTDMVNTVNTVDGERVHYQCITISDEKITLENIDKNTIKQEKGNEIDISTLSKSIAIIDIFTFEYVSINDGNIIIDLDSNNTLHLIDELYEKDIEIFNIIFHYDEENFVGLFKK